jgi:DNA-binding Lrp family transcriptional regulator
MPDSGDWAVIEQLQGGIPLEPRPYDQLADRAGMPVDEFLQRMRQLKASRLLRRMGIRLRHHQAGIRGNLLSVWRVAEADVERIGSRFAEMPEVSHCYERETDPDFPYNLYAMVHAPTEEMAREVVQRMAAEIGIREYVALKTVRELKKSTPRYTRPGE